MNSIVNILGDINGKYNIIVFDQTRPVSLSSFNASLCSVQTISETGNNMIEYRPNAIHNPFTKLVSGSGYIVKALSSFSIYPIGAFDTGAWIDEGLWYENTTWLD
jgi:hypothetical protein